MPACSSAWRGWLAEHGSEPTADDVAAHIAEISATDVFTIPETNYEEVFEVTERLASQSHTTLRCCGDRK